MDESVSEPIDSNGTLISSLTGILVPVQRYPEIRQEFYKLFGWHIEPSANTINMNTPELHGRDFLPGECDERKHEMFKGVVNLVVSNNLEIYRGGYYITKKIRKTFKGDENMLGLLWMGLLGSLKPKLENEMIIPVMDGFDKNTVRKFSQMVKQLDVMRAIGKEESLSIGNSVNVLGEVFYADSQHSIFTQVVDLVSWLRQLTDGSREGKKLTAYKNTLLPLSNELEKAIVYEEIVAMEIDGTKQSPKKA